MCLGIIFVGLSHVRKVCAKLSGPILRPFYQLATLRVDFSNRRLAVEAMILLIMDEELLSLVGIAMADLSDEPTCGPGMDSKSLNHLPSTLGYAQTHRETAKTFYPLSKLINIVCQASSSAALKVAQEFLFIFERLLVVHRCAQVHHEEEGSLVRVPGFYDAGLLIWTKMGENIGLDINFLRLEANLERHHVSNGLLGCSWMRCPLYEGGDGGPTRELMVCVGCHSV